jgi:hypothetical protein
MRGERIETPQHDSVTSSFGFALLVVPQLLREGAFHSMTLRPQGRPNAAEPQPADRGTEPPPTKMSAADDDPRRRRLCPPIPELRARRRDPTEVDSKKLQNGS